MVRNVQIEHQGFGSGGHHPGPDNRLGRKAETKIKFVIICIHKCVVVFDQAQPNVTIHV